MERTKKDFPDILSDLIKDSGKTLRTISEEMGISSAMLSKYQSEKAEPGLDALIKISNYFGVSIDRLAGLADAENSTNNQKLRMISAYTGLSNDAVTNLHGYRKRFNAKDGTSIKVSDIPTKERTVINALLTKDAGRGILIKLYSYLFDCFDSFHLGEGGKECNSVYLLGSELPAYRITPEDARVMISISVNKALDDLKTEIDEGSKK